MAFDAFLEIETIPGESTDDKHTGWIELLDFSLGVDQPSSGAVSTGGGRTAERVNHAPFRFQHKMDKASAKLYKSCCNGEHIGTVTLQVHRATGEKAQYYQVKMEHVTVGSVQTVGQASGAELPTEEVELYYGEITWTYTELDHETGASKGNVEAKWDLVKNVGG